MTETIRFIGYIGSFDGNFDKANFNTYFSGVTLQAGDFFIFDHDAFDSSVEQRAGDHNSGRQFLTDFYTNDVLLVTEVVSFPYTVSYKRLETTAKHTLLNFIGVVDDVSTLKNLISNNMLQYGSMFMIGAYSTTALADIASTLSLSAVSPCDLITVGSATSKTGYTRHQISSYLGKSMENAIAASENVIRFKQVVADSVDSIASFNKNTFYYITPNTEDYVTYNDKKYMALKVFVSLTGQIVVLDSIRPLDRCTSGYIPKNGSDSMKGLPVDSNIYENADGLNVPENIMQYNSAKALVDTIYGIQRIIEGSNSTDNEVWDAYFEILKLDTFSTTRYSSYKIKAPSPEYSREFSDFNGEAIITLPSVTSTLIGRKSVTPLTPTRLVKVSKVPDVLEDSKLAEVDDVLSYLGTAIKMTSLYLESATGQIAILTNTGNSTGTFTLPEKGGTLATNETIDEITANGLDNYISMFYGKTSTGVKKLVNSPMMKSTTTENGATVPMTSVVDGGFSSPWMRTNKLSVMSDMTSQKADDTVAIVPVKDGEYRTYDALKKHNSHAYKEVSMPHYPGEILTSQGPIDGGNY